MSKFADRLHERLKAKGIAPGEYVTKAFYELCAELDIESKAMLTVQYNQLSESFKTLTDELKPVISQMKDRIAALEAKQ